MAILQSVLQGQGVGSQIGGVSAATTQYVQQQVALQAERPAISAGGYIPPGKPAWALGIHENYESMAWLLLGLM